MTGPSPVTHDLSRHRNKAWMAGLRPS